MTARKPAMMLAAVAVASSLTMAGCARQISPGVYQGSNIGTASETYTGTVQSARYVVVQEDEMLQDNWLGGAIGGAAGGLAGSELGGGKGKVATTAGGALAGAALGALAQRGLQRQNAIEYIVRMDDGRLMTIVQGTEPAIPTGRRVYVQTGSNGQARVLPAG